MAQLEILNTLDKNDIDFHDQESLYGSHNFHSFPAKFPPQLPKKFILALTKPGDIILDPMNGSGTTTLEARFAGRIGIGLDIDPLAILISKVKITHIPQVKAYDYGLKILRNARVNYFSKIMDLEQALERRWDEQTKEFVDYWFTRIFN